MKKYVILLLSLIVVLTMVACSSDNSTDTQQSGQESSMVSESQQASTVKEDSKQSNADSEESSTVTESNKSEAETETTTKVSQNDKVDYTREIECSVENDIIKCYYIDGDDKEEIAVNIEADDGIIGTGLILKYLPQFGYHHLVVYGSENFDIASASYVADGNYVWYITDQKFENRRRGFASMATGGGNYSEVSTTFPDKSGQSHFVSPGIDNTNPVPAQDISAMLFKGEFINRFGMIETAKMTDYNGQQVIYFTYKNDKGTGEVWLNPAPFFVIKTVENSEGGISTLLNHKVVINKTLEDKEFENLANQFFSSKVE